MRAYFVSTPRTYRDLLKPHPVEVEREYEIAKTVTLSGIDYENFTEDMLADRQFIKDNIDLCSDGDVLRCLLVRQRGKPNGILVVPQDEYYVRAAAFVLLEAKPNTAKPNKNETETNDISSLN